MRPTYRVLYTRLLKRILIFFFNDTATTEIYTLSLHDALPIYLRSQSRRSHQRQDPPHARGLLHVRGRSEEHTSELQSQSNLVCRLLLEKKKQITVAVSSGTHLLYILDPGHPHVRHLPSLTLLR